MTNLISKSLLFLLILFTMEAFGQFDRRENYCRLNFTDITKHDAIPPDFLVTILPLTDANFALLWGNKLRLYKPDLAFGYVNSSDITLPIGPLPRNTRLLSTRKSKVDYFAFATSSQVFIATIDGQNFNVTQVISGNGVSVIIENGNFIVGSHDGYKFTIMTISPEGSILGSQVYNDTKLLNPFVQVGYGMMFIFYGSEKQLDVFYFNGTRISRRFGKSFSTIIPEDGGFLVSYFEETYPAEDYAFLSLEDWSFSPVLSGFASPSHKDIKNNEIIILGGSDSQGSFSVYQETAHYWVEIREYMYGAPFTAVSRASNTSLGAIYCYQNFMGCFIDLFDVLQVRREDSWFAAQLRDNFKSSPYFNSGALLHNIQLFPGFNWQQEDQVLYLRKINMSGLGLKGEFPYLVADLTRLESLDLSNNNLTGDLSKVNFSKNSLKHVDFSRNKFFGCPPVITNPVVQCDARYNSLECPDYQCNVSTLCSWRSAQRCELKSFTPAKPTPPWYWTSIKWSKFRLAASGGYWNDLIVIVGGYPDSTIVEFYNTTEGTWGTLGTLYQGRSHASVIGLGPYLLISGGISAQQPSAVIDIYNAVNDTWTITHFEVARGHHSAVAVDDEIWYGPTFHTAGFIEAYNPRTRKWRTISQNVTGQLAVTPYAVVASGGAVYFKEMERWSTFKSNDMAGVVAQGSNAVILSNYTLYILDTHGNIWTNISSPVALPSVDSPAVISENVLIYVDQRSFINETCVVVMYNFTSHEWSKSSVPNASITTESVTQLIATTRRQTWLLGAVPGSVTVHSWKGFRHSFWPPIQAPVAVPSAASSLPASAPALTPSVASPVSQETEVWPVFVVIAGVLVVAIAGLLIWFRKRGQKRGDLPVEENASLLSDIEEGSEESAAGSGIQKHDLEIRFEDIKVGEKLGEGSYGEIFKAKWHGQNVVVKMLKSKHVDQSILIEEAKTLISLRHKHIVLSMGVSKNEETNEAMIVMEYMKNGSLEDLLFRDKVTLTRDEIVRLALDVAKGLNYLHSLNPKIIHRDLKGANVLLYQNKKRAKISDFGTARLLNTSSAASTVIGTFGFIAPEILQQAPYNEKADIYSFGVLLFELVSNTHMPVIFEEEKRIEKIAIAVHDPELKQLIINCCRTDPIERPSIRRCIEILKQVKAK